MSTDPNCPRCNTPLRLSKSEGVEIYQCASCSGEWLHGEQLRSIIDAGERNFTSEERAALDTKQRNFTPDALAAEQTLRCPQCQSPMVKYRYAGDSPVVLDRCESCGGTWMDGGEAAQVQMLAESWEKELASDLDKYGGVLKKIEGEQDEKLSPERKARTPLVRAVMRRVLRFWGE